MFQFPSAHSIHTRINHTRYKLKWETLESRSQASSTDTQWRVFLLIINEDYNKQQFVLFLNNEMTIKLRHHCRRKKEHFNIVDFFYDARMSNRRDVFVCLTWYRILFVWFELVSWQTSKFDFWELKTLLDSNWDWANVDFPMIGITWKSSSWHS